MGEALQALPERWRTVLWLTEVEGMSPAEVSERIGIKPNAVAALAYRARKGLREAYLQAHLRAEASQECRGPSPGWATTCGASCPSGTSSAVQAHLDSCGKCRGRRDELTDVNATLRHAFLPVPLLLAGMERKWFSLSQIGGWWSKGTELGLAQAAADSPLAHKALAGVAAVALAIGGTAVPNLVATTPPRRPSSSPPPPRPPLPPPARTSIQLYGDQLPMSLDHGGPVHRRRRGRLGGFGHRQRRFGPGPGLVRIVGLRRRRWAVTRNRILPGVSRLQPGTAPGRARPGSASSTPASDGTGGPLADTPLAGILDTAVNTVDALVPLDLTVSDPRRRRDHHLGRLVRPRLAVGRCQRSGARPDPGSSAASTGLADTPVSTPLPTGASVGLLGGVTGLVQNVTGLVGLAPALGARSYGRVPARAAVPQSRCPARIGSGGPAGGWPGSVPRRSAAHRRGWRRAGPRPGRAGTSRATCTVPCRCSQRTTSMTAVRATRRPKTRSQARMAITTPNDP